MLVGLLHSLTCATCEGGECLWNQGSASGGVLEEPLRRSESGGAGQAEFWRSQFSGVSQGLVSQAGLLQAHTFA